MKPPGKDGGRWACDPGASKPSGPVGCELIFDPTNKRFTDDSVGRALDGVRDKVRWLVEEERVPKDNIRVVIGSGVQSWPEEDKVQGWSEGDPCAHQVREVLGQVAGRDKIDVVPPWEEVGCVAVQAVPRSVKGDWVCIGIGRDNITAAPANSAGGSFPNPLDSIRVHILGTSALDHWTLRKNRLPPHAGTDLSGPKQREDYANKLAAACQAMVVPGLKRAETQGIFETSNVYVFGEDAWAACSSAQPDDSRDGYRRIDPVRDPANRLNPFLRSRDRAIEDGARGNEVPPERLLSAAEVLRAMNDRFGLGKHHPVDLVDPGRYDWLNVYLERRLNGLNKAP
jgi:hypothetical protein